MPSTEPYARRGAPARWFRSPAIRLFAAALLVISGLGAGFISPDGASGLALGRGKYELTASVFGTDFDDLVGEETSSGHVVRPLDRIVALPACTESSCPWLDLGADRTNRYGTQTECAESDGLCWVQIISQETGECAVAPVLDRGPLFVRDDWWNLQRDRVYQFKRGLPAAEVALTGRDLGYGSGISDAGHDVAGEFTYAAAIDLGAGTFVDLGLDPDEGIGDVTVTLLWQARTNHLFACDAAYGNGQTIDDVNLRDGPSTNDDSITYLPANRRLSITGAMQNDFYLVDVDGMRGWVYRDFVQPDGGETADTVGFITDAVNMRAGPSTADAVQQVVPTGSVVVLTGSERNNFLSVSFNGTDGWISNAYVDLGDASAGDGGGSGGDTAETTDNVNFRSGPGLDHSVIRVLSPGTVVLLNGAEQNGFFSVTLGDQGGWISGDYLMTTDGDEGGGNGDSGSAETTDSVNFRTGPALSRSVIRVLPPGTVVTLNGDEENGFVSVTHSGQSGWISGDYLMEVDDDGGSQRTMTVLDSLNLRDGPSTADGVILVLPTGAVVTVTGEIKNGFYPVSYRGEEGWAHYKYLE